MTLRTLMLATAFATLAPRVAAAGSLQAVTGFGANPGALEMFEYVPSGAPANAPLVVFMHGCSQQAADAARVGWNELADQYGFYVLYPQQTTANNPIKCFNWAGEYGDPANLVRGMGENESIKEAVDKLKTTHAIDPQRVFVAGFSAGGGMTPVMLATWPDVFAAGAVMSGLPYRCATSVNDAYNCQSIASHPELKKTAAQWGDLVRAADPGYTGPLPRVVIFHGASDSIVSPDNLVELVKQWTNVHGHDQTPTSTAMVGAHTVTRYVVAGRTVVETWKIAGMGHAVSMGADPEHACTPTGGTYIEDRSLCAVWRAATFFGITGSVAPQPDGGVPQPDGGVGPQPDGSVGPQPDGGVGPQPDGGAVTPGGPSVMVTSPSGGSTVSGVVTIQATASAAAGIARVEFYVDGALKGSDGTAPYTQVWQTATYSDGAHDLKAIAYTPFEVSAEQTIHVTVHAGGDASPARADPISFGCSAAGGHGGAATALLLTMLVMVMARRRRS